MHISAMRNGADFFKNYCGNISNGIVLDIGSQDVNGSLREVCPSNLDYIGVDFVAGRNVDVIINDPYVLPFDDNYADVIVSSSCFEHSEMFWLVFLEVMRILKPSGVFYLSAPSNGAFHRYPVDCWRFYPDSGNALITWAKRNGINAMLMESFISLQDQDIWNDFTAVILKDNSYSDHYPKRMSTNRSDIENVIVSNAEFITHPQAYPEDQRILIQFLKEEEERAKSNNDKNHQLASGDKEPESTLKSNLHKPIENCSVCGSSEFISGQALWPDLIKAWNLSAREVDYVNEQQATVCKSCRSNVRSLALATALQDVFGNGNNLIETVNNLNSFTGKILEVNEAGNLHHYLSKLTGHQFASYPEYDLTNLSFADKSFDIVVHSDTLEHIPKPELALKECWRVLKPGGSLVFTVPVIIERMTRSREGLSNSFHGNPSDARDDMLVHTEYGADVWASVMRAGFRRCEFFSFRFPAGIAILARK